MADERVCDLSGCSGPLMDTVHEHILTSGCVEALKVRLAAAERERDEARGLLRDVDTAWSDCLLTEDQADVLERIVAYLGRSE